MPVVEIFLRRGRTPAEITVIADAIHDALVGGYSVPQGDRFQIVHQLEPHELIFDQHFMGGPRTAGFLLVRVTAGKHRQDDAKRKLYSLIVDNVSSRAGIAPSDVMIVVDNVQLGDLSLSHGHPYDVVLGAQTP